jgi:hypothetical protein
MPTLTPTHKRAAGLGALALGATLLISSCGSGPKLSSPGENSVTEGAARVHEGDTVTIGSLMACLNKPGSVTITNVEPLHPTGIEVTGWALRPNPFWKKAPHNPANIGGQIGVARAPLSQLAFPASRKIDTKCGDKGEAYEIAVQVKKVTSGEAGASGWIATYDSGGKTRKIGFTVAVKLCNEDSADAKPCQDLKV